MATPFTNKLSQKSKNTTKVFRVNQIELTEKIDLPLLRKKSPIKQHNCCNMQVVSNFERIVNLF